jgi:methionine sulfoxide reductase heme-binding subunit
MTEGPFLWYLNRGSGVVLLVLLTVTTVLGVLSLGGRPARGLPRFATQALHRNLALLSVVMLAAHVVSAVVDEFVDIRWWQAFVPFGSAYERFWLGLGAVALDLMAVVVVTSLLRHRMRHRAWRLLHVSSYGLWLMSLMHGLGMGTDLGGGWWLVAVACATAVPVAAVHRLALLLVDKPTSTEQTSSSLGVLR